MHTTGFICKTITLLFLVSPYWALSLERWCLRVVRPRVCEVGLFSATHKTERLYMTERLPHDGNDVSGSAGPRPEVPRPLPAVTGDLRRTTPPDELVEPAHESDESSADNTAGKRPESFKVADRSSSAGNRGTSLPDTDVPDRVRALGFHKDQAVAIGSTSVRAVLGTDFRKDSLRSN
jgi:hypothetical protein